MTKHAPVLSIVLVQGLYEKMGGPHFTGEQKQVRCIALKATNL